MSPKDLQPEQGALDPERPAGSEASLRTPWIPPAVTFEEELEALATDCSSFPGKGAYPCTALSS